MKTVWHSNLGSNSMNTTRYYVAINAKGMYKVQKYVFPNTLLLANEIFRFHGENVFSHGHR